MFRQFLAEVTVMKNGAVFKSKVKVEPGLLVACLLLAAVGVLGIGIAFVATAKAAPPIGKGGQVRACYQVKGKEKGSMRVVAGKHCRRGERKLAWSLMGPQGSDGAQGSAGSAGSQGQPGLDGAAGSNGTSGASGVSTATVTSLESKVTSLESEVTGLTSDLTDVEGDLGDVCEQAEALNSQVNLVGAAIGDIELIGGLVSLVLPEVDPIDPFLC